MERNYKHRPLKLGTYLVNKRNVGSEASARIRSARAAKKVAQFMLEEQSAGPRRGVQRKYMEASKERGRSTVQVVEEITESPPHSLSRHDSML